MFYWIAYYHDGTELKQRDGGTYEDIDRPNLAAFGLFDSNDHRLITVDFRPDCQTGLAPKRLIWRRRVAISPNGNQRVVHLVGWQRKVAGQKVQAICYVTEPDGEIILGGQWQDDKPFMDSVVPYPFENDLEE